MGLIKVDYGSVGGEEQDFSNYSFISKFTVAGNQIPHIPTPNGKAKACFFVLNDAHVNYIADGCFNGHAINDGTEQTNRTYTFSDTEIVASSVWSTGSTTCWGYVIY